MDNLVFSNMLHRPARTIVSILGIAVGVMLIVFTVGLANGSLREQAKREANVGAEIFLCASGPACIGGSGAFRLPVSLARELEKTEGVKSAVAIGQQSVNADSNTGKRLIDGVNFDEYAAMSGIRIVQGRTFNDKTDEALIDTGFQKQKKFKVGDTIKLWERNFTIVGTYEPAGGARVKIPLSTMQKQVSGDDVTPENSDKATAILVKIKDGYDENQVGDNILKVFPDYQLVRTKDLEELYLNSIPALDVFLNVIIGVATSINCATCGCS
jgi:putative ABC transport system permease protein